MLTKVLNSDYKTIFSSLNSQLHFFYYTPNNLFYFNQIISGCLQTKDFVLFPNKEFDQRDVVSLVNKVKSRDISTFGTDDLDETIMNFGLDFYPGSIFIPLNYLQKEERSFQLLDGLDIPYSVHKFVPNKF